jgi:Glycosyltransferase family 87
MYEPRTGTRALSPTLALCLALIGAAAFLYYHEGLFMPRVVAVRIANGLGHGYSFGNDFYQVWLSCRELLESRRDPYSLEMTLDIQRGLYGRPLGPTRPGDPLDQRVFPYPAYTDLLFWPTAIVPFPIVRVAVLCVLIVLTVGSVLTWLQALEWRLNWQWTLVTLLLTLCSYSALEALFAGQIGLLVAFLIAGSVLSLQRGRFLFAGFLMALATIKPQVVVLAIIFLLLWTLHEWRTRHRFWIGFFSTMAILVVSSLLILPHWIQSWIHTILAYRHYTRPPLVTEVLTSPLGPRLSGPATLILTAISLIIALVLAWRNRVADAHSFPFWLTLATLLAITTITILPGQAVYDDLILIPGILLLIRHRVALLTSGPAARALWMVGIVVLLWPWIAALLLIALRPLVPPATFDSTAVFSMPIRTAASLPFAVLALLAWCWKLTVVENPEAV